MKKNLITILVHNRPGVLSHVAGLVTRRGYNVDSIAAGPTQDHSVTRITLVVAGDTATVEQVVKQFQKLVDVISVEILEYDNALTGELALITLQAGSARHKRLMDLASLFGFKIIDIRADRVTVEVAGSARDVDTVVAALTPFPIIAMARTGLVALPRSQASLSRSLHDLPAAPTSQD
ncbi:MAG: acetolactate synthase small subunit [Deltaproteobacteria bacterium]|jgi:acetolactate synthase-1/3 small subunit|nr:acetolactate synthase small subunit [Deltaproteobacteria bacterium]